MLICMQFLAAIAAFQRDQVTQLCFRVFLAEQGVKGVIAAIANACRQVGDIFGRRQEYYVRHGWGVYQ